MTILIIGAKGGLGQAFMEVYADEKPIGLDKEDLDITNEADVLRVVSNANPGLIINCAAYNSVDSAEEDRAFAENVNGYAPGFLAHAAATVGAIFVHYSSGQVFQGLEEVGYNEEDTPDPINAYGFSKLLGEKEVAKNTKKFYIIRTAWLFGPTKKKSFIDLMLEKARSGEIIKVVNDEFGTPTYAKDLAQSSRALIEMNKPSGIYHLINEGVVSRFEWAKEIFKIKKIKTQVNEINGSELTRVAKRPKYEVLQNTKYIQLRPWQEALKEFLVKS